MKKLIIIISIIISGLTEAFAEDCQHKVALFLTQPNYSNYHELHINNSIEVNDTCWPDLKKDTRNLARLYEHTKQGNIWAIRLLIKHTSDLDGGELEDAYIALGESIDREPRILLREFKEQRMTKNQFAQALVMLPLSFTDNEKRELSALKARKRKIIKIKDASLKHQKELGVKVLNSQITQINNELP